MADEQVATKEVPLEELSQEDYKKARAEGKKSLEKPIEKPAEEEPKEVEPEQEVTEEPEEEKEPEPERPKGKGGFQKRIDKLIKEKAAAEERLAAAERRAKELESKVPKEEPKPADGEPKADDFKTYEEYTRALARWEVRQELKAEREAQEKRQEEAATKAAWEAHQERMQAAQAKYEDWDEISNVKMPWSSDNPSKADIAAYNAFSLAIVEDENSADLLYHYGTHPDELEALGEMTPSQIVKAVARASDKLESAKEKPKPKLVSKAPPPIKPVTGGSTKSSQNLDEMDMAEYKKARAAGRKQ